jgi:hypothetical protein
MQEPGGKLSLPTLRSPETSVNFRTAWHYIPEDGRKSQKIVTAVSYSIRRKIVETPEYFHPTYIPIF